VAALAVHPADESVNHAMVNSDFAQDFFKPGAVLGALPTLLATRPSPSTPSAASGISLTPAWT